MSIELKVYLEDGDAYGDLLRHIAGQHPGVSVEGVPSPKAPEDNTLSGANLWDFLSVVCAPGGAGTVAIAAVALWVRSRGASGRIEIGGDRFPVDPENIDQAEAEMTKAVKAWEGGQR